jgi:hypothetical protein
VDDSLDSAGQFVENYFLWLLFQCLTVIVEVDQLGMHFRHTCWYAIAKSSYFFLNPCLVTTLIDTFLFIVQLCRFSATPNDTVARVDVGHVDEHGVQATLSEWQY